MKKTLKESIGVSSGKIDETKLFYIMTRGISKNEAKKLIVKAQFSEIIQKLNNEDLQNEIYNIIDNLLEGKEITIE